MSSIQDDTSSSNRAVASACPGPTTLTRAVELRRTRTEDGSDYLAIFIKKPLASDELELLTWFLDTLAPGHGWTHQRRIEAA